MTKRMFEGSSKAQGGSSSMQQQHQHQQYLQQMHHQAAAAAAASGHGVNMNRHVSPAPSPSNLSQRSSAGGVPDYTQVSPAKMALRRHLSQEKLSTNPVAPKTIGDLVNGEIERTLEISHQSIINAAVNMSTNHPIPMEVYNVARPERVNVRGPEEYNQAFGGGGGGGGVSAGGYRGHEMSARYSGQSHENSKMMATSTSTTSTAKNSSNLFMASYTSNSLNSFGGYAANNGNNDRSTGSRDGSGAPTSCLPRAEMKPYLEQYFLDDQFAKSGKMSNSRSGGGVGGGSAASNSRGDDQESHRMSGPLEGLAASLQARVRATLNIKEEPEMVGRGHVHGAMKMPMNHPVIKQEGK